MKKDIIAMTRKQFRRYQVIQETIDGHLTVSEAAEALGLSTRQIKRLKKGVKLDDAAAIIH
ncbi:MAG: helix-turn-helix domain-containing protein, partial [Lachnospiraceae bacterium]|nr:helix-turn-helix domain-containing protein [Lachnospiraceae bacterium]